MPTTVNRTDTFASCSRNWQRPEPAPTTSRSSRPGARRQRHPHRQPGRLRYNDPEASFFVMLADVPHGEAIVPVAGKRRRASTSPNPATCPWTSSTFASTACASGVEEPDTDRLPADASVQRQRVNRLGVVGGLAPGRLDPELERCVAGSAHAS